MKELAAAREALETSEREKRDLQQQLFGGQAQSKDQPSLNEKQMQNPAELMDLMDLHDTQNEGTPPPKLELLIEKHLESEKMFSFPGEEDVHITAGMARNYLKVIVETLHNLQKFPWEAIKDYFQVKLPKSIR